jgi:hypothetical protein
VHDEQRDALTGRPGVAIGRGDLRSGGDDSRSVDVQTARRTSEFRLRTRCPRAWNRCYRIV